MVRQNGKEVQDVVDPDEGHGFQRPENRLHFYPLVEQLLAKHVGGRAEPLADVKGHTGRVK
jgi:dipeptidyl aminopeptidase/acylaminoacyl peptidase